MPETPPHQGRSSKAHFFVIACLIARELELPENIRLVIVADEYFEDRTGMVVADSRTKSQSALVAHSIFTKKLRRAGDRY